MTTADKIIIIVGIIIFTICDIGVYGLIMKRIRELEDKYLGVLKMTQDCIDISKQALGTVIDTVKGHTIEDHPMSMKTTNKLSIDIPEREPQIYEPSGVTKEDIIKECDSEGCSINSRASLVEFIMHHLGAIVKIFDKEGLLLRNVLNDDPNEDGWLLKDLESSGIYIYYLVKCEGKLARICSMDWTRVYHYKFDDSDDVDVIVSIEPILEEGEISKLLYSDDFYYNTNLVSNVVETNTIIDDILKKMREQHS